MPDEVPADILALDDYTFTRVWADLPEEKKATLPADVCAKAIERFKRLSPWLSSVPQTKAKPELIRSDRGVVRPCDFNALQLLNLARQYEGLYFDDFTYRVRIGARDWTDADDRDALCWLQSAHRVHGFTLTHTRTAVMALAHARRRDTLAEFVLALPEWDRSKRIATAFAVAWGVKDSPLARAASRNFFIALMARALLPGAQVDNLFVFEGPQGAGKSRALRALGDEFHAEISAQVGHDDFYRQLRGVWIAELAELDAFRGREASTVKRLLSAPSDRFVEKFEKHAQVYKRRAVAVATTNENSYWMDSTGARRLIPLLTGAIDVDLIEAQRLQWFAEARHEYKAGATWWEFPAAVVVDQDDRQIVDPWEDVLRDAMANGRRSGIGVVPWPDGWIASSQLMRDWLRLEPHQQGQSSSTRLGKVMRRLGYVPHRLGKTRERGWLADTDEPKNDQVSA